ncbi:MAG: hypothetical protein KAR21_05685, partial [Spirochaetales bacterium]|nr:hypothetical protein [Spirochaetales bacterium]
MKKIILLLYLSLAAASLTFAFSDNVSVSIRFFDKKIYYPDSEIQLQVRIVNNSINNFSFNSAEIRSFNFNFNVKTLTNISIRESDEYLLRSRTNNPVFYREITLLPGEEYAFITRLDDFVDITESGIYIIQSNFYPEFQMGYESHYIESNTLTLSVRPSIDIPIFQEQIDIETGEILEMISMPPDEVVKYVIEARLQSSWTKFFLYLDLESLLLNHPDRKHQYNRLSEEKQMAMIDEYKNELKNKRVDNDILLVPSSFEILKTSYTQNEATVVVDEEFIFPDYTEFKKYTFYLHRYGAVWTIYNYEVR